MVHRDGTYEKLSTASCGKTQPAVESLPDGVELKTVCTGLASQFVRSGYALLMIPNTDKTTVDTTMNYLTLS